MLRLRAWVFFLFLLLIGALLVATAPSFQACLSQAGPASRVEPAAEARHHRHRGAHHAGLPRALLHREPRRHHRRPRADPRALHHLPVVRHARSRRRHRGFLQAAAPRLSRPERDLHHRRRRGREADGRMHDPEFRPDAGVSRELLGRDQGARFDVGPFRADASRKAASASSIQAATALPSRRVCPSRSPRKR